MRNAFILTVSPEQEGERIDKYFKRRVKRSFPLRGGETFGAGQCYRLFQARGEKVISAGRAM